MKPRMTENPKCFGPEILNMKLPLHHHFVVVALAALLTIAVAANQYDPLKQMYFHYSMGCSSLRSIPKDAELWRNLNLEEPHSVRRHGQSSHQVQIASCHIHDTEIEGLVDDGGCTVAVTAITTITDECLDSMSVFSVSFISLACANKS